MKFPGMILVLLGLLASPALSQDLVGDRPDFTESAVSLAKGRIQLEAGATWTMQDPADLTELGEVLVRLGLGGDTEARLGLGSWLELDTGPEAVDGLSDLSLGLKHELSQGRAGPRLAFIAAVTVPTGDDAFTADTAVPEFILAAEWDLDHATSLGMNLGGTLPEGPVDRFFSGWVSASVGHDLGGGWGGFVETYVFNRVEAGGDARAYADTGLTYGLSPDLQLDVRVGTPLDTDDWFVGTGLVLRI